MRDYKKKSDVIVQQSEISGEFQFEPTILELKLEKVKLLKILNL